MMEFLVFQLYGPMASWGDTAVGEQRPSFAHPSKSAVTGLVAGALGIRRGEEEKQQALFDNLGLALRVEAQGVPLVDYHTAQVPGRDAKTLHTCRAEELAAPKLNTILSSRQYRLDALYSTCLWLNGPAAGFTLAQIAEALQNPVFTPYLGRKSCPPGLPFLPQVVQADSIRQAFDLVRFHRSDIMGDLLKSPIVEFFWEGGADPGMEPIQSIYRNDAVLSRGRWQFGRRSEYRTSERRE